MLKFARHGAHNHLEVQVAADGLAGFQEACARRPDIILLDYVMPVHDGLAFLDLYALEPTLDGVPVILHSIPHPGLIAMIEKDYPMVKAVVRKPITPSQMLQAIEAHLQR